MAAPSPRPVASVTPCLPRGVTRSSRNSIDEGVPVVEMHQIRYFLAVADELNFTRAATKCNVSQPSLTRAIKLLEDELGGPLFHRERANTHLSELGRTVRPNLVKILAESTEAKRIAQDFRRLNKTILKLGVMCTIGPNQLI